MPYAMHEGVAVTIWAGGVGRVCVCVRLATGGGREGGGGKDETLRVRIDLRHVHLRNITVFGMENFLADWEN